MNILGIHNVSESALKHQDQLFVCLLGLLVKIDKRCKKYDNFEAFIGILGAALMRIFMHELLYLSDKGLGYKRFKLTP